MSAKYSRQKHKLKEWDMPQFIYLTKPFGETIILFSKTHFCLFCLPPTCTCKLIRGQKTVKSTLPKFRKTAKPSELLRFSCQHYHRLNVDCWAKQIIIILNFSHHSVHRLGTTFSYIYSIFTTNGFGLI